MNIQGNTLLCPVHKSIQHGGATDCSQLRAGSALCTQRLTPHCIHSSVFYERGVYVYHLNACRYWITKSSYSQVKVPKIAVRCPRGRRCNVHTIKIHTSLCSSYTAVCPIKDTTISVLYNCKLSLWGHEAPASGDGSVGRLYIYTITGCSTARGGRGQGNVASNPEAFCLRKSWIKASWNCC